MINTIAFFPIVIMIAILFIIFSLFSRDIGSIVGIIFAVVIMFAIIANVETHQIRIFQNQTISEDANTTNPYLEPLVNETDDIVNISATDYYKRAYG